MGRSKVLVYPSLHSLLVYFDQPFKTYCQIQVSLMGLTLSMVVVTPALGKMYS